MTKRDILKFLFKWNRSIISMWLFSSLLITILVYVAPPTYKSEAIILVEKNRSPIMRTVFYPGLDAIEVQNTEIGILLSRSVIEAVIDDLKPHERPKKETTMSKISKSISDGLLRLGLSSKLSPKEYWIKKLTKKIKAKPVVQSSIINVTYYDEDPVWGAKLLNNVVNTYIQYHLKIFTPEGSSLLYKEKMEDIQKRITAQLDEVSELKNILNEPAIDDTKRDYSYSIRTLREKIINEKNRLLELLVRFQNNHEDVRLVRRKVFRLESQIQEIKKTLIKIESQEARINNIDRNLQTDQKTYNDYNSRYEDAKFSERSNVNMLNVRVVQYSPVSTRPDHSRLFYIILGIFGSFLLSLFIALIRQYFDHRVDDPDIVEDILGIPSIGSIKQN